MAASAISRARRIPVRSALTPRDLEDDQPDTPPDLTGKVQGSFIDWTREGLFLDPESHEIWDNGDRFAIDMRRGLDRDHKLRELELVLTQPNKGSTWKLEPGEGDRGEAKDTEEKLRRPANAGGMETPIDMVLAQATSCRAYKRAYFAKGFKLDPKRDDGSVMYSELAMRPASTCRLRRDPQTGGFDGFAQDVQPYTFARGVEGADGLPVTVKPSRALVFINGQDRDPIGGISDLEVAYWCWQTKKKITQLWLEYLAAQALPRTMVTSKGNEDAAKRVARVIAALGSSGVGYTDEDAEWAVLDTSGKGPQSFLDAIKMLNQNASGSALASFLELGPAAANGAGSFALSKDQTDLFLQLCEGFNKQQAAVMSAYCVADLVRYNYGRRAAFPTFTYDQIAGVDEQPILTLLQALATVEKSALPQEFVNELAMAAARLLGLDADKLKPALEAAAKRAEKVAVAQAANPLQAQQLGPVGAMNGAMGEVQRIAKKQARKIARKAA